ncbi:MAG TPA: hypothetical protein VIL12_04450 [Acidimicrobiia bacterium]
MQNRDTSVLSQVLTPEERAIEAVVGRYQRVAPAITRFARSLSNRDHLRVRLGSEAASTPDEIVIDPGIFQAAYSRRAPVTPEEVALASALHEAVHLVSTDLDEARPVPREWGVTDPPEEEPVQLLEALGRAGGSAAETLFFALEDARQERAAMAGYPGARSVLQDLYQAALPDGFREAGVFAQFALACFYLVGEHTERREIERRVAPQVAVALNDAVGLLEDVHGAEGPWEVASVALRLLIVARLHGLTRKAEAQGTGQQRLADQVDADDLRRALDEVRLPSPIVEDRSGYERTRRGTDARAASEGRRAEVEIGGDPATDQILRISESPTVYLPTGQGGKLVVDALPDRFRRFAGRGDALLDDAARAWGVAQHHVSGELYPLFVANQRRGLRSGFDAGDLSPHAALFIGAGLYKRIYERRQQPTRRAYAVSLLIDGSASMLQPRPIGDAAKTSAWGLAAATLGAWTLARLADELQVEFEVALFNRSFAAAAGDCEQSFRKRRSEATGALRRSQRGAADRLTTTVNHYLIKSFDQPWRAAEPLVSGLFWTASEPKTAAAEARRDPSLAPPVSMFERAANVDEFNLTLAAQRMAQRRARVRVLIVLADGMTRGSLRSLEKVVQTVEGAGTTVLGIGIGDDTVAEAYPRAQVVAEPTALTRAMVEGTRSALRRSLALWGFDAWWIQASRQSTQEETRA